MKIDQLATDLARIAASSTNSPDRKAWAQEALACVRGLENDVEGARLLRAWWGSGWWVDIDLAKQIDRWVGKPKETTR